jgi:hypothetical protein
LRLLRREEEVVLVWSIDGHVVLGGREAVVRTRLLVSGGIDIVVKVEVMTSQSQIIGEFERVIE